MRNVPVKKRLLPFAAFLSFVAATPAHAQVRDDSITSHVSALRFLVGEWEVLATFHGRDGDIQIDDGTYKVTPILGGSYLQVEMTMMLRGHPTSAHSLVQLITYNPKTKKYDGTYFYSRSALRVSEQGEIDPVSGDFRTVAFIPKEDGVRDENVHTVTRAVDPNHVQYTHFSRYNNESKETMDLEILLTRKL